MNLLTMFAQGIMNFVVTDHASSHDAMARPLKQIFSP